MVGNLNGNRLSDLDNEFMVPWGERVAEGVEREFRMDMYTLLYLGWITTQGLL